MNDNKKDIIDVQKNDFKIPVRTEIEVLPADLPKDKQLGFIVREYLGTPLLDKNGKHLEDINVGDSVYCYNWLATVTQATNDQGYAKDNNHSFLLKKDLHYIEGYEEDINVWCCIGVINLRGVSKLEKKTE